MFVSIINDCSDNNAMNRQASRSASYLNCNVFTLGVSDFAHGGDPELEAAGNLIDTLDATGGEKGVVLVNVAIRHGKGKKWLNGTPFGYFYYKKTLVISSVDGYVLSLAKKFNLTDNICLLDLPTVIDEMIKKGRHEKKYRSLVVDSQFRSYQFTPRVAKWLMDKERLPYEKYSISEVQDAPHAFWWVDNFGNTVTTLLPEDIEFKPGKKIKTRYGILPCYNRLKDVPNGKAALIIGSWGINNKRFISLVVQGKSAADKFNIKTGDLLF